MSNVKVKTKLKVNKQKPAKHATKGVKGKKPAAKKSATVLAKVTRVKSSKIIDFSKAIIQQVNKSKREAYQQLSQVVKLLNVAEKNNDKLSKKVVQLQTKLHKAEAKLDNKKTPENKHLVKTAKHQLKILTGKAKSAEQDLRDTRKTFDSLTQASAQITKLVLVISELYLDGKKKPAKVTAINKKVVMVPHEDHSKREFNNDLKDDFNDHFKDENQNHAHDADDRR